MKTTTKSDVMIKVKLLKDLTSRFKSLGDGLSDEARSKIAEAFSSEYERLTDELEALPIKTDAVRTKPPWWQGFILSKYDGEWWPCRAMNYTKPGWVEFRIDLPDGSSDSGVAPIFRWADCTADQTPAIPSLMDVAKI